MKKAIASLVWSLDIECPHCGNNIDLSNNDSDGIYSMPIFNNRWKDLLDKEVECLECEGVFKIEKVEY